MTLSVLRTAQAHDVASVRAILELNDNTLSLAADISCSGEPAVVQLIENTLRDFPFLLALEAGRCRGFTYARPHQAGAYRWSADVALHVDPHASACTGERLYRQMLHDLAAQGYLAAYALVSAALPKGIELHQSLGFVRIGCHHSIDLQQEVDCWCLSLGERHPAHEPMSYQALLRSRRKTVTG